MRGIYVLVIRLPYPKSLKIGGLGKLRFEKGFYAYVGSAQNSLEKRIERHLSKKKKMKWHIDYLLKHGKIEEVWIKENAEKQEECITARAFARNFSSIHKFGASDCACESHLFYSENLEKIKNLLKKLNFIKFL